MKSKKNGEFAHIFIQGLLDECIKKEDDKFEIEKNLEQAFRNIIQNTTLEIMGNDN